LLAGVAYATPANNTIDGQYQKLSLQ